MTPTDLTLAIGATLRLTRLATTDSITEWITGPTRRRIDHADAAARAVRYQALNKVYAEQHDNLTPAAARYALAEIEHLADTPDEPITWQARLASALDCPHCIGFWLGAAVLATHSLSKRRSGSLRAWRALTGALTLSYLTGHTSARLD